MQVKTYVITLSQVFPATHPRAGEPTEFKEKFQRKSKLHTIRANWPLWARRVNDVRNGCAVLSVRQWTGKPYRSKQIEIARLEAADGVGVQMLKFDKDRDGMVSLRRFTIDGSFLDIETLAKNDGLSLEDWKAWFKDYDLSKPMAILQFTDFRY